MKLLVKILMVLVGLAAVALGLAVFEQAKETRYISIYDTDDDKRPY